MYSEIFLLTGIVLTEVTLGDGFFTASFIDFLLNLDFFFLEREVS